MPCNNPKNNLAALVYKLLNDILALLLLAYLPLIAAEAILPGIISPYASPTKFTLAVMAATAIILYLGKKYGFAFSAAEAKKNKLFQALVVIFILLSAASLFRFRPREIIATILITLIIFFYFRKIFFSDSDF